jgi:hypothetical protein
MVLHVANADDQPLQYGPVAVVEAANLHRRLVRERREQRAHLFAAVLQVAQQLVFREYPFRKHAGRVQLIQRKRRRWHEPLGRLRRVVVEEEEGVIRHVPELRPLRTVAPQRVRARGDRVLQHVDRRAELVPEGGSE